MGPFLVSTFLKKEHFVCLYASPKQMLFLTISNENIVFNTRGTGLGYLLLFIYLTLTKS